MAELSTVKSQFAKKYGGEYVRFAELNEDGCVNPKVVDKLDCQPPSGYVVTVSGQQYYAYTSPKTECKTHRQRFYTHRSIVR